MIIKKYNDLIYNICRYHKKQMDTCIHSEDKFDKPIIF